MLETRRGSEDGFAVRCFEGGRRYRVAESLARAFIRAGWATEYLQESPHEHTV